MPSDKLPKYQRDEKPTFFEGKKGELEVKREEAEKQTEKMLNDWNKEIPEVKKVEDKEAK